MTYISRKTRLLVPRWFDECDPAYLYHLNRKRSEGRLKRHSSCDDLRAWVDDQYLNYQYFLELVTDGEFQRRSSGIMGRIIPVEDILNVLCGDELHDNAGYDEITGSRTGKRGPKPGGLEGSDVTVTVVTTDDILKITDAAMSKLENISNLIQNASDNEVGRPYGDKNDANLSCGKSGSEEQPPENISNREDYLAEYNNILRKISCLQQRLAAINQRREELKAKVQSLPQAMCRSSSGMTITELYSREEQMHTKRLEKRIEKLIHEKGQILKEIYQLLKYLDELKKNIDPEPKRPSHKNDCCPEKEYSKNLSNCICNCKKNENGRKKDVDESAMTLSQRKKGDIGNSDSNIDFRREHSQGNSAKKCSHYQTIDSGMIYMNKARGNVDSSEAAFTSGTSIPESQRTYQVSGMLPDTKSKSEITLTNVDEVLRSYEQRLSELGCLEVQIEELKKKASMASYFKKRWLRCTNRGRAQNAAERATMKEEIKQLWAENNDLKNVIMKLSAQSEKEQKEIQYWKYKRKQLCEMEEEIMELRKELDGYQISYQSQRERIGGLENTVIMQRDRIEKLKSHIARLCRASERKKEAEKVSKKYPRSRSYGPENNRNLIKPITHASSEETLQHPSCCHGCSCTSHSEWPNRPTSESGKRMSIVSQQTWRRQSCNNQCAVNQTFPDRVQLVK